MSSSASIDASIRKATIDDVELLIRLRIDFLLDDRGHLTDQEEAAIRAQLAECLPNHIGRDFIALLAETEGKVVSTAFMVVTERPANPTFITGKVAVLLNVFTYPEHRRMGYATRLVSQLIDEAKQLGVSLIDLYATPNALPLYQKLGFTEFRSQHVPMRLTLVV